MSYKLKRPLDIAGSLILGVGTLPLQGIIALAIKTQGILKKEYEGPIIYSAPRIDENGNIFYMHKFRTMKRGADKELETLLAQYSEVNFIESDYRVTPVGRFLRRFSLDELPQFYDVFRGYMSLVGPRPRNTDETIHLMTRGFTEVVRKKPGLTSVACINGRRDLSLEEAAQNDSRYQPTLQEDLHILWRTLTDAWYRGK